MRNRQKKRIGHLGNKGVSLIELIIVIAIIALTSTVTFQLIGQVSSKRIYKAAKTIDITLDKLRVETMSKGVTYSLCLYLIEGDLYMTIQPEGDTLTLTKENGDILVEDCQVSYQKEGVAEEILEEGVGNYIAISYSKSSGAFHSSYERITFRNGNYNSILRFVKETGKHWIE
ncbi:MAG: prepilin-type N-terminal cleavage/methylation domain-containing protein [Anaerocolumna sp.]